MTPTIRIDDEVYEALRNAAVPFADTPNSVLRRLLELDETAADETEAETAHRDTEVSERGRRPRGPRSGDRRRGGQRRDAGPDRERGPRRRGGFNRNRMQYFFEAGLLQPGDTLVWERRNNDERYTATVDAEGHFHLEDGEVFETPSGAARHLAGYDVSGWRVWARESDGKSLGELARDSGREPGRRGHHGRGHRPD